MLVLATVAMIKHPKYKARKHWTLQRTISRVEEASKVGPICSGSVVFLRATFGPEHAQQGTSAISLQGVSVIDGSLRPVQDLANIPVSTTASRFSTALLALDVSGSLLFRLRHHFRLIQVHTARRANTSLGCWPRSKLTVSHSSALVAVR